jgi:hypothetical protein
MRVGRIVAALAVLLMSGCGGGTTVSVRSLSDSPDADGVAMQGLWLGVGDARERTGGNGRATFEAESGRVEICAYGFSERPEPSPQSCVTVEAGGRVDLLYSDLGLSLESE